jgi:hypothetical protein
VNQVAFLRDGKSVVSEGWTQLAVWTQGTGNDFRAFKLPPATLGFSLPGPDRSSLLVTTFREELLLMEITSGREISRFSLGINGRPIAVSTDTNRAAVVKHLHRDSYLQEVWDLTTKKVIWSKITDNSNWNGLFECSPDVRLAAIVDSRDFFYSNKLRVEEVDTGKCILTWEFHDKRNQGPEGMECWIVQLDDEEFTVREDASANLERVEGDAENLLEKTLQGTCSLETRRRIVILLETLKAKRLPTRVVRALELLEQVGTADAVEVLRGWEKKAADRRIREEVRRSLGRLAAKQMAP